MTPGWNRVESKSRVGGRFRPHPAVRRKLDASLFEGLSDDDKRSAVRGCLFVLEISDGDDADSAQGGKILLGQSDESPTSSALCGVHHGEMVGETPFPVNSVEKRLTSSVQYGETLSKLDSMEHVMRDVSNLSRRALLAASAAAAPVLAVTALPAAASLHDPIPGLYRRYVEVRRARAVVEDLIETTLGRLERRWGAVPKGRLMDAHYGHDPEFGDLLAAIRMADQLDDDEVSLTRALLAVEAATMDGALCKMRLTMDLKRAAAKSATSYDEQAAWSVLQDAARLLGPLVRAEV
ncbi:hypothetical protein [Azospirillum sp. ST 5-10]|uniref:hypothetical protein n=1 Tax=unclassified Azospirillum TaxID=2630922 RepID=UPI003F49D3D6